MKPVTHKHLQPGGLLASIRELVFGLEDSLVSTVGVVVGVAAGAPDRGIVLLSGSVLIVVEALSMAAGSFLSSKSHREMLELAIREEEEEIEKYPEEEKEELRGMYSSRGFSDEEVEILVRRITADKKLWLEEMTAKELKINAVDLEEPGKNAVVMFFSYIAGGMIPLTPFLLMDSVGMASAASVGLTVVALFGLGYAKGRMLTNNGWKSGLEMLVVASAAAGLGYLVGKGIGNVFNIDIR